jgi:hypothetical protein
MAKQNSAVFINHGPVIGESSISSVRLAEFKKNLLEQGIICPRPWYWGRFFSLFRPHYESYWLMQWWSTSDEEKNERFLTQLDYLAYNTMRFQDAYWYLNSIGRQNWYYSRL